MVVVQVSMEVNAAAEQEGLGEMWKSTSQLLTFFGCQGYKSAPIGSARRHPLPGSLD